MDVHASTSVEQILLDRVEKQLQSAGITGLASAVLLQVLRGDLEDTRLSPEEEKVLFPEEEPAPGRVDGIDRFIAVRVERALASALAIGSRMGGLATPLHAPRVVVYRSKHSTPKPPASEAEPSAPAEVPAALPSLGTASINELGFEGFGVLVLADRLVIEGYLDRHSDLRVGDHGLGLHFRGGADEEFLTLGEEDFSAVHVLDFETAFPALEYTLELAVRSRLDSGDAKPAPTVHAPPPLVPARADAAPPARPIVTWEGAAFEPVIAAQDPNDRLVGTIFDEKYLVVRRIGKGGFGLVYEAQDLRLDHRVAIKLLHQKATRSPEELEAFKSEARRATRLSHPNIVEWKTFEQSRDGGWYFVMELLEGEELDEVLKREGMLDAKRTGRILLQVLDALRAAHDIGGGQSVLHLDLKPKNVFLIRQRRGETGDKVKVIDFGIGQFIDTETAPAPPPSLAATTLVGGRTAGRDDAEAALAEEADFLGTEQTLFSVHKFSRSYTDPGRAATEIIEQVQRSTACTPEYAAPEQCAHLLPELPALPLDGRADLYAVGVMGFQMLTGELPFDKPERRKDLLHIKQSVEPRKVGSMGVRVPKDLAQFIDRCLARNRDARFADASEAYDALRKIVHPPLRKRTLAAAAALVLAAVVGAWMFGKSLSRQAVDLFARVDGVEKSLAGSRLYLGPDRAEALLRVSGLDSSRKIERVRIVDGREAGAREIQGFHASARADRQVLVSADASSDRIQRPAYLEVKAAGKDAVWSVPFDLVWLGRASWSLAELSIRDLGERAVDPLGASLEIRVHGSHEDLSSVRVACRDHALVARRNDALSRRDEGIYSVPLEALGLENGPAELHVLATDWAGCTREQSLLTVVATGALALSGASLDATAVGGRYSISPRSDPRLSITASRKADVSWTVRDENGATLMKGAAQGIDAGQFPLEGLRDLRGGQSFSGTIEVVADETPFVLHADPENRGIARRRLDFLFADSAPDYSVRLSLPDVGMGVPVDSVHPVFVGKHDLVVRVGRESSLPLQVQVLCAPLERPEEAETLEAKTLVDREAISAEFPLRIAADGEYALTVRVWRYDIPGRGTSDAPDSELRARLVVDSSPATLRIRGPESGIVLRKQSDPMPKLSVLVEDEAKSAKLLRTPVDLRWDLVLAERPDQVLTSGLLGTAVPGGAPVAFEIPAPWSVGSKQLRTLDGTYSILVQGLDAAGNKAVPARISFETAVDGPELELAKPAPRIPWVRGESGGFEIQVVARDPNGISDVRGVVHRAGSADVPFHLHSTGDFRHEKLSVWTGAVAFDETWSNSAVEVRLASEDGFGTSRELPESRELGPVDRVFPLRVAVEFEGVPVETLHLVEGNSAGAYTFGGRVDAEEERTYAAAGLPSFNSLNTPRSWRVGYEAHEIQSFYLDENEVSVEQYLAFVRADRGYASSANWPRGATPDPERRSSLDRELASRAGDLPVSDVTWEEAFAYARWVGKRLPSLVEWEFAVRGGALYRPFASARTGARAPARAEVNYDPQGDGDGVPWPCSKGGDLAEDTGIRDLCGNVAEWTSTPASFLEGAATPRNVPAHVLENRALFLEPRRFDGADTMQRYWVAGGSFRSARADFLTVDRRARGWRGDFVGFRCASDVKSAMVAADSSEPGRPRFRGMFE